VIVGSPESTFRLALSILSTDKGNTVVGVELLNFTLAPINGLVQSDNRTNPPVAPFICMPVGVVLDTFIGVVVPFDICIFFSIRGDVVFILAPLIAVVAVTLGSLLVRALLAVEKAEKGAVRVIIVPLDVVVICPPRILRILREALRLEVRLERLEILRAAILLYTNKIIAANTYCR